MHFKGIVGKGKGEGTLTGFPTANIPFEDSSLSGIYAARAMIDGRDYLAAAYADTRRGLLEAHLLDFTGDLYGKEMEIVLVEKIRDDKSFEEMDELKKQIEKDVSDIRAIMRAH